MLLATPVDEISLPTFHRIKVLALLVRRGLGLGGVLQMNPLMFQLGTSWLHTKRHLLRFMNSAEGR